MKSAQPVLGSAALRGRFALIRVAAGLAETDTVVVNVEAGELPAGPARVRRHHCFRLGGVRHRPRRLERTHRPARLHGAAHGGMPLFGICYGHQLLAHALGGQVDYNPAGRESGTIELELHPPA